MISEGGFASDAAAVERAGAIALLRTLLSHAPFGFAFLDTELRYLHVNEFLGQANGLSPEAHVGRRPAELFPQMALTLEPRLREVLRTGRALVNVEIGGLAPRDPDDHRFWLANYYPVDDEEGRIIGVGTVVLDVTERRRVSEELRERDRQQEAVAELGHRALAGAPVDELLDDVVTVLAATLDVEFGEVLEVLPDQRSLLLRAGVGWAAGMVGEARISASGDSQAGYVLASGRPVVVGDLSREDRFSGREFLTEHSVLSGLSVPIMTAGQQFGVLAAHSTRARSFSDDDVNFVQALANVIGAAVERSRAEDALRDTNASLRLALQVGSLGTWEYEIDTGRIVWSELLETMFGLEPGGFTGTFDDYISMIHPDDRSDVRAAIDEALTGGSGPDIEHRIVRPDGEVRWVQGRGGSIRDRDGRVVRMLGLALDVTERKLADEERTRLWKREQEARTSAEAARERLAFLSSASAVLGESLDYSRTLPELARLAVPTFADCCVIDVVEDGRLRRVAVECEDTVKSQLLWSLPRPTFPDDRHPLTRVLRSGDAEWWEDVPSNYPQLLTDDPVYADKLGELELGSLIVAPLMARGRPLGVMSFGTRRGRSLGKEDRTLAQDLARRAGLAVDNARLFAERSEGERRFRRLAETLQESLLPPHLPDIPGADVAAAFRPTAKGVEVGGDFYDVFPLRGRGWGVVIGDVCGKGPEAATLTALARYTLRTAAMRQGRPSRAVRMLNEVVLRDTGEDDPRFLTLAYGTLRPGEQGWHLSMCSGGHPLPLLLRAGGRIESVGAEGMLIGVVEQPDLSEARHTLKVGDTLLLYTDGVLDARGPRGQYGEQRLVEALRDCIGLSAAEVVARIEADVLAYSHGAVHDDLALLALRIVEDA